MIIAQQFQPGLNVAQELKHLDKLAQEALNWPVVDVASLVDFMTNGADFRGNKTQYYSVGNSLLNQVLATRRGIPISLAVIYLSVVKRLAIHGTNLNAIGINFPAHFLLKVTDSTGEHLIDPFAGGIVSTEQCYDIIANLYGHLPEPDDRYFRHCDNGQLLRRMLENLKAIQIHKDDLAKASTCLDFQLILYPQDQDLLKQQQDLVMQLRGDKQFSSKHPLQ